MNILIIILLVTAGIIIFAFVLALFMKKDYKIQRDVIINAPKQKVFDYVKFLKNQDHYNKWVMVDPDMKKIFKGMDGTAGFIYGWNGNKRAGEGELEIKALEEGKRIETEIRFVRPFAGLAKVNMLTESVSADQTKVIWSNESKMGVPLNIMLNMIEKMLAKDMDASLMLLKNILDDKTAMK